MDRDYRRAIYDAVQAGDVGALASIAHVLLNVAEADEERRARQAAKKRKQRGAVDVPGQAGTNGDSGGHEMSRDVPGQRGTKGDISPVVHTQRSRTTTHTPPPSAQVIAKLGDDKLQSSLDRLCSLMGDKWEDVASFLLRRKYIQWQGWADTMLREVGMSSQYTPDDLARVCNDEPTLDKPLGSAYALRQFLSYARVERVGGNQRSPPSGAARTGSTSRRDTKVSTGPALAPTDVKDIKWQT